MINDLIAKRQSARQYSSAPVENGKITSLIEAASWAPSSYNLQPWHFIIFDGKDKKAMDMVWETLPSVNDWVKKAPLLIVVCQVPTKAEKEDYAFFDLGLACENMLLESYDLGLVSCPLSLFDKEKFKESFKLPADFEPKIIIAIGYPSDNKVEKKRTRKPASEISSFNG